MVEDRIKTLATEMVREKFPNEAESGRAGLVEQVAEGLRREVNEALISALPEEKLSEFERWLNNDAATEGELTRIFEEAGVDEEKVARRAMLEYREFFMNDNAKKEEENGE